LNLHTVEDVIVEWKRAKPDHCFFVHWDEVNVLEEAEFNDYFECKADPDASDSEFRDNMQVARVWWVCG
jgi:hypothetical protein